MIIEVSATTQPTSQNIQKRNPAMALMLVIGSFLFVATLSFCYLAQSTSDNKSLFHASTQTETGHFGLNAEERNLASRFYDDDDYYGNDRNADAYGSRYGYDEDPYGDDNEFRNTKKSTKKTTTKGTTTGSTSKPTTGTTTNNGATVVKTTNGGTTTTTKTTNGGTTTTTTNTGSTTKPTTSTTTTPTTTTNTGSTTTKPATGTTTTPTTGTTNTGTTTTGSTKPSTGTTTTTSPSTGTTTTPATGTTTSPSSGTTTKPATGTTTTPSTGTSTTTGTTTTTAPTTGTTTPGTTTTTTTTTVTTNPSILTYTSGEKCTNGATAYLTGLTAEQKAVILAIHNSYRSVVAMGNAPGQPGATDMLELVWDDDLAAKAQNWANSCTFDHDSDSSRSTTKFKDVGQNLDEALYSAKQTKVDFTSFVTHWYDEVNLFNGASAPTNSFKDVSGTGHYTQVVWAKTSAIGCGFKVYKDSGMFAYQLTCNYGAAGNWIGEKIYTKGTFDAAKCKNGASTTYQGLCKSA